MEPSSLHNQKSSFLTQQIRLLSSPLQRIPQFNSTLPQSSGSTQLTAKSIDDVVAKVSNKIKSHNKSVFAAQSQRHIVAQIEALYFNEALDDTHTGGDVLEARNELVTIEKDTDLTSTDVPGSLPEELQQAMLSDVSDFGMDEADADRYADLRGQLLALAGQRDAAREKLLRYQRLQELLRPFENAGESVQKNLVTKDGEMSRELERMRMLLARVSGRLGEADTAPGVVGGQRAGEGEVGREGADERLRRAMEGAAG